jgi:hypothetical protein
MLIDKLVSLLAHLGWEVVFPLSIEFVKPQKLQATNTSEDPDIYSINWGVRWKLSINSDSDDPTDLDQIRLSEAIKIIDSTKDMANRWKQASLVVGKFDIVDDKWLDDNSIGKPILKGNLTLRQAQNAILTQTQDAIDTNGAGIGVASQYYVFTDQRTGATDEKAPLVVPQSGFTITVSEVGKPNYAIKVTRIADANNGAGKGIISDANSKEQEISISIP